MPTPFTATRKRAAQARVVCGALVACFGPATEADKQRIVANARIYDAAGAILLGHIVEGYRGFELLVDSGQEAVAEAFRMQAETLQGDRGLIAEWGAVSNLFHRARTLGQGDPRITRMAYEESVRARESASRSARWVTRLLTPRRK